MEFQVWQSKIKLGPFEFLEASNHTIIHGGLYRSKGNSFPFFVYQKLKEILIRYGYGKTFGIGA